MSSSSIKSCGQSSYQLEPLGNALRHYRRCLQNDRHDAEQQNIHNESALLLLALTIFVVYSHTAVSLISILWIYKCTKELRASLIFIVYQRSAHDQTPPLTLNQQTSLKLQVCHRLLSNATAVHLLRVNHLPTTFDRETLSAECASSSLYISSVKLRFHHRSINTST